MRKELIKLGDKLAWDGQTANVGVVVIDVSLKGGLVGISDGGFTHIVDASKLAPFPTPTVAVNPCTECEPVPCVVESDSPLPSIKVSYDEKIHSLFILINDKSTICISNVTHEIINAVGIAHKHDDDNYNKEIGNALAFYRSACNEQKARDKKMFIPFQLFK